eukprot:gene14273-16847_t
MKSSLGPRSMSKMIVKEDGEFIITNDGASILRNLRVNHPAASLLVSIALAQDRDVGDGTTSVVLLACQLVQSLVGVLGLDEEQEDQEQQVTRVHQTTLTAALHQVGMVAVDMLEKEVAVGYDSCDLDKVLLKIAGVSLGTKHYSYWKDNLVHIALAAVKNSTVKSDDDMAVSVDVNNHILVIKMNGTGSSTNQETEESGSSIDQSEYLKGLVITSRSPPSLFPTLANQQPTCCLLAFDLASTSTKRQPTRSLTSPSDVEQYLGRKDNVVKIVYDRIVLSKANIIFSKHDTYYSSVLLRGPSLDIVDDLEIGIMDALYLLKSSIESPPLIVYGGGSCEIALSVRLRQYATTRHGTLHGQVAVCLADCFTVIPSILAANCNVNPLDIIPQLSHLHSQTTGGAGGSSSWGIDGWTGKVTDMSVMGIVEPVVLKKSIIQTSIESVITLLPKDYNLLVHKLSGQYSFIQDTLQKKVNEEGIRQPIELGIFRSDYMVHQPTEETTPSLYQVELNTISSSFGSHSTKTFKLHRHLIENNAKLQKQYPLANLPENDSLHNITRALAVAHSHYINAKTSVVMIIVQPGERNIWDQRALEYALWSHHQIKMIRRSLADINARATLDPTTHALFIDGQEISVAYFRAGYTPDDYPTNGEWSARLLIERSLAIKSPSIANHLVGTKKIQQAIVKPGLLESLIQDDEAATRMRTSFTGLYSLSSEDIDPEVVAKAIASPSLYVMKPQREGGGNNIYNEQVKHSLKTMSKDELSSYILMDRIVPRPFSTQVVRDRQLFEIEALYELGVFSLYIG